MVSLLRLIGYDVCSELEVKSIVQTISKFLHDIDSNFGKSTTMESLTLDLSKYCMSKGLSFPELSISNLNQLKVNDLCSMLHFVLQQVINSDKSQDYIQRILTMSIEDQQYLMELIQLDHLEWSNETVNGHDESPKVDQDYSEVNHNLKRQIGILQEENESLKLDLRSANERIESLSEERDNEATEKLVYEIKCRLKEAQEELIMFEHNREDQRIQRGMIEKEVQVWRDRALDAERKLDDTVRLKDEIDNYRKSSRSFSQFLNLGN